MELKPPAPGPLPHTKRKLSTVPLRVLVVDDNEAIAESIKLAIEDWGDKVRTCSNGLEALGLVRSFKPEVLLLDLTMPGMDGLQVARTLREDPEAAGLKIVAQTGHGDSDMRMQTAKAGFDLHLTKPVSLDVLSEMLTMLRNGPRQASN